MLASLTGHNALTTLSIISLLVGLCSGLANYPFALASHMPIIAIFFMFGTLGLTLIFNLSMYRQFTIGFLLTAMCGLIAARIAGIYSWDLVTYPLMISLFFLFLNFCYSAYSNLHAPEKFLHKISAYEWQLTFIRLYIGFDLVSHFTEKLLAGPAPHLEDVQAFIALGVPHADLFVWLAGLCELGGAIAIGLGLFTRLGAICTVLYLLIATILGHHFSLGFIWANSGGGWEYPLLWSVLILSFTVNGAGKLSLDQYLADKFVLSNFTKYLMGIKIEKSKKKLFKKKQHSAQNIRGIQKSY